MRRIEPHRPIIAIMEDLDALIRRFGEPEFLSMLDGEAQIDNVVYVGTTNYLEHLDDRIKKRPSRFDQVLEIGFPSENMRAAYFRQQVSDVTDEELKVWIPLCEGMTFAMMREFIVSIRCLGKSVEDTTSRLNAMMEDETTSDSYKREYRNKKGGGFGFQAN